MTISDAFELLTIFDSPLVVAQAPELMKFKSEVDEVTSAITGGGCTSCKKRALVAKLANIQTRMQDEINQSEVLKSLIPTFLASAKLRAK